MPASEYYAIYQQSKKLNRSSSFSDESSSLKDAEIKNAVAASGSAAEELQQDNFDCGSDLATTTMEKLPTAEVKVHGGGIAER